MITHLTILHTAVVSSKPHTPTDEETKDPEGKFKPNVLNTVVFLVSTIQIVGTFGANYAGAPFMKSLSTNKKLHRTMLALCAICFACALGWFPNFEKLMQIAPLPSEEFRNDLLTLMAADLTVSIGWERLCRYLFRKKTNSMVPLNLPDEKSVIEAKKRSHEKLIQERKKMQKLTKNKGFWATIKEVQEKQRAAMERNSRPRQSQQTKNR